MQRREFMKAGAGSVVALNAAARGALTQQASRPNIILIMVDDMGYSDIGCYGSEIHTPNIDTLAQGGVRFTQFYNCAKCSPTRASITTGLFRERLSTQDTVKLNSQCVTIAEVLKDAGYRTLMTGKWHQPRSMPVERGFDRSFGLNSGCCNHWNPGEQRPGEPAPKHNGMRPFHIDDKEIKPFTPEDKDWYSTDAFTQQAIDYLEEYKNEDKPFFLYLAYTAPHYPLHAWPDDIAKYEGVYDAGYEAIKQSRVKRMRELGIISESLRPSTFENKSWQDVRAAGEAANEAYRMQVYAAMIDRVDQNVGRIMAKVRERGEENSTLVMFLSDNGSTDEGGGYSSETPGTLDTWVTVGRRWANVSNTPFRKYKKWTHEGGCCTPFIACWPGVITNSGSINHNRVGHVMDIMATCIEAAGTSYPEKRDGRDILPMDGKSLLPALTNENGVAHESLCWYYSGAGLLVKAVRKGEWKLVSGGRKKNNPPWELYNIKDDRTELNNLVNQRKDIAQELKEIYSAWEAEGYTLGENTIPVRINIRRPPAHRSDSFAIHFSRGKLRITRKESRFFHVCIMDSLGRKVFDEISLNGQLAIDLRHTLLLPNGHYLLTVSSNGKRSIRYLDVICLW